MSSQSRSRSRFKLQQNFGESRLHADASFTMPTPLQPTLTPVDIFVKLFLGYNRFKLTVVIGRLFFFILLNFWIGTYRIIPLYMTVVREIKVEYSCVPALIKEWSFRTLQWVLGLCMSSYKHIPVAIYTSIFHFLDKEETFIYNPRSGNGHPRI